MTLFINLTNVTEYLLSSYGLNVDFNKIRALINLNLLPLFKYDEEELILISDLESVLSIFLTLPKLNKNEIIYDRLFQFDIPYEIRLRNDTIIELVLENAKNNYVFFAALRNLIINSNSFKRNNINGEYNIYYFSAAKVITSSRGINQYINNQMKRSSICESSKANKFAESASYMGSKRNLSGFLVEVISNYLPSDGIIIDLMCGSGAASGAFNKIWKTIASDAQEFCKILAVIQGGGFSAEKAKKMLKYILPITRKHIDELRIHLNSFIKWEDRIIHRDIKLELLEDYRNFIKIFPTYPNGTINTNWNTVEQVEKRKKNPKLYPFCLFTSYFANIYFGLRQCVEIDSLRYAIDQIKNENERKWALGALIATMSKLGTTYGGHFAQPLIKQAKNINIKNLSKILEIRANSIIHEFSKRLISLAEESEKTSRPVEIISGPWYKALSILDNMINDKKVIIYLDAPYKREEYSRYYHILETIVTYTYPSSVGSGKIPDKNKGERFRSEFFTRSNTKLTQAFVKIISEILKRKWICAWSYSNSGDVNIVNVINQISKIYPCIVKSYAVQYEHKSHGGRKTKKVIEYLILFFKKDRG